ncbi:MAG: hypothetical protein IT376_04220 [Polyangiaceae bacterium]|nr:hypothetical protein [Polyangiaceae bacterium]
MSEPSRARFALGHATVEVVAGRGAAHVLARLPTPPPTDGAVDVRVRLARARRRHPGGRARDLHFDEVRGGPCAGGRWLGDGRSLVRVGGAGVVALLHDETPPWVADGVLVLAGLAFALRALGVFHLHAACLQAGRGTVVLVPGGSGAGKTTLALALRAAGLTLASDDATFVSRREGSLRVSGWPRAPHLGAATWGAFRHTLAPLGDVQDGPRPKRAVAFPGPALGALAPARVALLFPTLAEGQTSARVCSAEDTLLALLEPSALVALPGDPEASRAHLALLGHLAATARSHRVAVGRDLLAGPAAAGARLLRQLDLEPVSP